MELLDIKRGSPGNPVSYTIKDLMQLQDIRRYINILFSDSSSDFKGFIAIRQSGKVQHTFITYNNLDDDNFILDNIINQNNIFISPNTFKKYKRQITSLYQIRCCFVDLDISKNKLDKFQAYLEIKELVNKKVIPKPTMIVDSGGGYHLYWRIKDSNPNKIVKEIWKKVQDNLVRVLKKMGADDGAKDLVRVLRIPGTYNTRYMNRKEAKFLKCRLVEAHEEIIYNLLDLKEFFKLEHKPYKKFKCINGKNKFIVGGYKSLNHGIIEDLDTLLELRNYNIKDYRNKYLFIYAVYLNLLSEEEEIIYKRLEEINRKFRYSLRLRELRAICRSVISNTGDSELSKLSLGDIPPDGYKFKNSTIIKWLDIDETEMTKLRILIDSEEKKVRNTLNHRKARRGNDGLTDKQREQLEKRKKALELQSKGLSLRNISKTLNISISSVRNLLK